MIIIKDQYKYEQIFNNAVSFAIMQSKYEFTNFLEYLDTIVKPVNLMEIGICNGATFFSWCNILGSENGIKIGIDYPNGGWGTGAKKSATDMAILKQRLESYKPNTHIFYGSSREKYVIDWVEKRLNGTLLDFLFIDGDHSYDGVKADFDNYSIFVKPGGVIAFHDIVNSVRHHEVDCYVDKFWAELEGEKMEFLTPGNDWAGIGVLKKEGK